MEEIGKVLPSIFKRQIRREDPQLIQLLASLWSHVAGKLVAEHSQPVDFADGTLTLESDCTSWAVQLGGLTEEIQKKVNGYLGAPVVKRLKVRCLPGPGEIRKGYADKRKMI